MRHDWLYGQSNKIKQIYQGKYCLHLQIWNLRICINNLKSKIAFNFIRFYLFFFFFLLLITCPIVWQFCLRLTEFITKKVILRNNFPGVAVCCQKKKVIIVWSVSIKVICAVDSFFLFIYLTSLNVWNI